MQKEQVICKLHVHIKCYALLCFNIFSPHNKGLPHPKVSKRWNLDKPFVIPVLFLPSFKRSKLSFVVPNVSNSLTAYCVVIRMVDF